MTIQITAFNTDGSIDVIYATLNHSGTIPAMDINWSTNMDGSENHNYIKLNCPDDCGYFTVHPVGGGADAPVIQEMFVRKIDLEGCACGAVPARSSQVAIDHAKELVTAMDGAERWQLDETKLLGELRGN